MIISSNGSIAQSTTDRAVTASGISIGTGLALETLFDIEAFDADRVVTKHNPEDYQIHVYNILTLFRNLISSIGYKDKDRLISSRDVHDQLLNDMYLIETYYKNISAGLIFYLPEYAATYKKYNKGKDDLAYNPYVSTSFMLDNIKKLSFPGNLVKSISTLGTRSSSVLILTNFVVDLLNSGRLGKLSLLESHTGVVKSSMEWGNKYHAIGKRDISILPNNSKLLYILGDKTLVKPLGISVRKELYELAVRDKWTPAKSDLYISNAIKKLKIKIPV